MLIEYAASMFEIIRYGNSAMKIASSANAIVAALNVNAQPSRPARLLTNPITSASAASTASVSTAAKFCSPARSSTVHVKNPAATRIVTAPIFVASERGLLGCGAIDPGALQRFGYPAARVRPTTGLSVRTVDDLLDGEVTEANEAARALGVTVGMTGRAALARII